MSLRSLEEKRKFRFYRLSREKKQELIKKIRGFLNKYDEILLAVIYGSFIRSESIRDIDIAVFTRYKIPYNKVEEFEDTLSRAIEEEVGLPIDLKIIDYAPPWFRIKALDGIVVLEKSSAMVARLKFKARQEINDIQAKEKILQGLKSSRKRLS